MKRFLLLVSLLVISFSFGVYTSKQHYQPKIEELQKQVSRQTKRIAEITGNGG